MLLVTMPLAVLMVLAGNPNTKTDYTSSVAESLSLQVCSIHFVRHWFAALGTSTLYLCPSTTSFPLPLQWTAQHGNSNQLMSTIENVHQNCARLNTIIGIQRTMLALRSSLTTRLICTYNWNSIRPTNIFPPRLEEMVLKRTVYFGPNGKLQSRDTVLQEIIRTIAQFNDKYRSSQLALHGGL
jgi:hypothetical protein